MHLQERAAEGEALKTNLAGIVQSILEGGPSPTPPEQIPVGDAAILMAADGYGVGKVIGKQGANAMATYIRYSEVIPICKRARSRCTLRSSSKSIRGSKP